MTPARFPHRHRRGNALAPLLMIFGALAVSGTVFFLYTRKQIPAQAAVGQPEPAVGQPQAASAEGVKPPVLPVPTPVVPAPVAPKLQPFTRPGDLGAELSKSLASGDLAGAAKIIAPASSPHAAAALAVLDKLVNGLGYKPSTTEKIQNLGTSAGLTRIAVPLASPAPGAAPARIILDLERDPVSGWKVAQIHLPKELEPVLAAMPASPAVATAAATPPGALQPAAADKPLFTLDRVPDPLVVASDFVNALLKPDPIVARKFVDVEKVPPVKLAALCMVFEDGKYELDADKPLASTIATGTTAWIIAAVHSPGLRQHTEFGLEMARAGDSWAVEGMNLSKFLSDTAKASALNGIPYSPLVLNPKGGESIALFFELDQAELHPRAKRQLDIIVDILKASPQKKLRIGGYTDALGSDDYNLNLSKRRADAVKEYITESGVSTMQVETVGFGKALPLSPNVKADGSDNPEGRSRNRRAEILLDF